MYVILYGYRSVKEPKWLNDKYKTVLHTELGSLKEYLRTTVQSEPCILLCKSPFPKETYESLLYCYPELTILNDNEKVAEQFEEIASKILPLSNKIHIRTDHMLYAEIKGHHLYIHYMDYCHRVYMSMNRLSGLPPGQFIQCHASYLVNLTHVTKVTSKECILKNNEVIPVSYLYSKRIKNKSHRNISQQKDRHLQN